MNFFELYGLPVQLSPDKAWVKRRYYELSRQHHPDFYLNAPPEEQARILQISSDINKAYKIFQDRDATIRYVLQLKELLEDEEKYALNPDFLMEVMEINEMLMDLEGNDEEKIKQLETRADELQQEIYEPVRQVVEGYVEGVTSTEELLQVKDYYYKKRYLERILDKISELRNIAAR